MGHRGCPLIPLSAVSLASDLEAGVGLDEVVPCLEEADMRPEQCLVLAEIQGLTNQPAYMIPQGEIVPLCIGRVHLVFIAGSELPQHLIPGTEDRLLFDIHDPAILSMFDHLGIEEVFSRYQLGLGRSAPPLIWRCLKPAIDRQQSQWIGIPIVAGEEWEI